MKIPKKLFVVTRQPGKGVPPKEAGHAYYRGLDNMSDSTKENMLRWGRITAYNHAEKKYHDPVEPASREEDNLPLEYVTLVELDYREEGGRAYQVLLPNGERVDMREEPFLEAVLKNGVEPGGKIPGPFIWMTTGSQMRLIRVGSADYKTCKLLDAASGGVLPQWLRGHVYRYQYTRKYYTTAVCVGFSVHSGKVWVRGASLNAATGKVLTTSRNGDPEGKYVYCSYYSLKDACKWEPMDQDVSESLEGKTFYQMATFKDNEYIPHPEELFKTYEEAVAALPKKQPKKEKKVKKC